MLAKDKVTLKGGQTSIELNGANITLKMPGLLDVKGSSKSFVGPKGDPAQLPGLPVGELDNETHAIRFQARNPETGEFEPKCGYILTREDGTQNRGVTDREGFTEVIETMRPEQISVHFLFKSPKGAPSRLARSTSGPHALVPSSPLMVSLARSLDSEMKDKNIMTIVLGDEFDDALRAKLLNVLRGLGAFVDGSERRAIVGSQDLEELDVLIDGQLLHVEAETYVGLSICGPAEQVQRIQRAMAS